MSRQEPDADDRPWKVTGDKPSLEARVRAALALLGEPTALTPEVLAEVRRTKKRLRPRAT